MEIKDLKEVSPDMWLIVFAFLLATIIPGVLYIFLFDRGLFIEIETFKMVALAISLTAPVWFMNMIIASVIINAIDENEFERLKWDTARGAFITVPTLFLPILIKIFTVQLSVLWTILIGIAINIVMILLMLYYVRKHKNTKR